MKHQVPKSMLSVVAVLLTTSVLAVSGGPSTGLLNFAATISGIFNDEQEVGNDVASKENIVHDKVEANFIPADIPFLRPDVVFYAFETNGGQVVRKEVHVIKETVKGVYSIFRYRLKDQSRFGSKIPNADDLASLTPEDLTDLPTECNAEFHGLGGKVYWGPYPDCNDGTVGTPNSYRPIFTCQMFTVGVSFNSSLEKQDPVPYVLKKKQSFPLMDYVTQDAAGWEPPCGNA